MARFLGALVSVLVGLILAADAAETPTPSPSPNPTVSLDTVRKSLDPLTTEQQQKVLQGLHLQSPNASNANYVRLDDLKKALELLPADQQQRVLANLHKWQSLSQEERDDLRERQRLRKQKQEESIQEAYQQSHLHLNEKQKAQFRDIYIEQRRKLEEQLAKDIQEKRQAGINTIIEQLRKEFAAVSSPSPSPSSNPHTTPNTPVATQR
jgi:gas vesicle protein